MQGIKHSPSVMSGASSTSSTFLASDYLRQHCRSDAGLLSNVVSIRFSLCIFSNSRHKHTGDCYSFWMRNRTRTRVARIDYSLLDVSAGEQDFHKIHKALFFHFFSLNQGRWQLYQS